MISEQYINSLLKIYINSPAGKARLQQNQKNAGSQRLVPSTEITKYGEMMKNILYKYVHNVISSISLDDIIVEPPTLDGLGYTKVKISFREESLKRDSLYPEKYDGLQNVVLAFTRGWHTQKIPYGVWTYNGKNVTKSSIFGIQDREPNAFLQNAVMEFNNGSPATVFAKLEAEYE